MQWLDGWTVYLLKLINVISKGKKFKIGLITSNFRTAKETIRKIFKNQSVGREKIFANDKELIIKIYRTHNLIAKKPKQSD